MVVTMGAQGAVYATNDGEEGWCPAKKVDVKDTTGAGDAFFAGVTIGLTYGKTMAGGRQNGPPAGRVGHLHIGKRLPALSAERVRHRPERA